MYTVRPRVGLAWRRLCPRPGAYRCAGGTGKRRHPIDFIAGTSMGALVGALYAREREAAIIKKQATQLDWVGLASLIDPAVPEAV